jgi:hypothetical protein
MDISLPYWSIPATFTVVMFLVMLFWPYRSGGDYSFNVLPILFFFLWIISSLAAWLVYFMVF